MELQRHTCCFTGHRSIPVVEEMSVKICLRIAVEEAVRHDYRFFGVGGALGFDTLAARTVLALKPRYPHIRLILVLPCINQTVGWHKSDIDEYERIKKLADKVAYTSKVYQSGCMHKRNRHLVDHSSLCICYLTQLSGGTAYTVRYAESNGLKIRNKALEI